MKKFVLIEVIGREISYPEIFDTYEKAYERMEIRFNECYTHDENIDDWKAWCKNADDEDCDWRIFIKNILPW